jgi:ABC-type oligopeptide transport system substrate-binding subunit
VEVWPGGPLFGRRFDLASFPWRAGSEPPCELYLSTDIPNDSVIGGVNNTGFANPEFDAACLRARQSFDAAESRAAHAEAQAIFSRDLPSLPLFFRFRAGLARPEVSGYQLDTTARSDLWNIEQIGVSGP